MLPSEILKDCFFHDPNFKNGLVNPLPYAIGAIFQSLDQLTISDYTTARCIFDIFISQLNPSLESDYFNGMSCLADVLLDISKINPHSLIDIMELAERNAMQE